jgi:acetyltransferase-like isoleucine patch superfamily enzyme
VIGTDEFTGAWDYASLPPNVVIGEDCYLESKDSFARFRSTREPGLILGDGVKAYAWTAFNVEPSGRVEVGADSLLVGALFMCAENISVGEGVIISYNVAIADCDFHPYDPELRKKDAVANAPGGNLSQRPPLISRPVVIEDDVWVGIGAFVLKGVRVGTGARVGAGAVVTSDVPPGTVVVGNPARVVPEGLG